MSLFGGSSTSGSLPYETTDTCDKLKAFGIVCRQLPNPMPFVGTADCANFTSLKVRTPCTPLQPTLSDPVYPPSQPGSQPYVPAPSSGNGAISDEAGQGIGGISTTMWIIIIIAIGSSAATGTGTRNIVIGAGAGNSAASGGNNTIIGYNAKTSAVGHASCILIGADATSNAAIPTGHLALGAAGTPIAESATVGAAGAATAPPATPQSYLDVSINGTRYKIPLYLP